MPELAYLNLGAEAKTANRFPNTVTGTSFAPWIGHGAQE